MFSKRLNKISDKSESKKHRTRNTLPWYISRRLHKKANRNKDAGDTYKVDPLRTKVVPSRDDKQTKSEPRFRGLRRGERPQGELSRLADQLRVLCKTLTDTLEMLNERKVFDVSPNLSQVDKAKAGLGWFKKSVEVVTGTLTSGDVKHQASVTYKATPYSYTRIKEKESVDVPKPVVPPCSLEDLATVSSQRKVQEDSLKHFEDLEALRFKQEYARRQEAAEFQHITQVKSMEFKRMAYSQILSRSVTIVDGNRSLSARRMAEGFLRNGINQLDMVSLCFESGRDLEEIRAVSKWMVWFQTGNRVDDDYWKHPCVYSQPK